ncbi:protein translocase subunit SecF [Catenulispora sp. NF23]|uniref:Protein-export membrane protein SecF n=1 Tax=Catenulispora pinistramenti TaxID=2705254 RepID=A0ABS5KMH1_9ACTN|nr:protein translocase subunit SecF [Catenulispora pinistramenti]MBS2534547.1 protein translocase subunit SecF [Catenulispora pinistramenti]MBS2547257.1 protein translocase subunit SecF [Catenulispora pinistramenti]
MSAHNSWGNRLYRGEVSYDFIGKQKRWYGLSGALLLISIVSLLTLGLNFTLDFRGGSQFDIVAPNSSSETVSKIQDGVGAIVKDPTVQTSTDTAGKHIIVKTTPLSSDQLAQVRQVIATDSGAKDPNAVGVTLVSGSWGHEITQKAIEGLIIFVALVMLYLAVFYEWKMALSGIIALIHDLVITAGIYALIGFEVSPATVIGFLTILGYSLYDTVVVFDKVRENTKGLGSAKTDQSYTQAANLAVNQTLIRSLNTSLIALIPVASLLFAGTVVSGGAGVLQDLALALLVGIAVGTYSSIFIATPLLADLKEREPEMRTLKRKALGAQNKAAARAERSGVPTQDRLAPGFAGAGDGDDLEAAGAAEGSGREVPRGPRNQPVRGDRGRNRPSGKRR